MTVFSGFETLYDDQNERQSYANGTTVLVLADHRGFLVTEPLAGGPVRWTFRWDGARFTLAGRETLAPLTPTPVGRVIPVPTPTVSTQPTDPSTAHSRYFMNSDRPLVSPPVYADVTGDGDPEYLYVAWESGGCKRTDHDQGIVSCSTTVVVFHGATPLFDSQLNEKKTYRERTTVAWLGDHRSFQITEPATPNIGMTSWTFVWDGQRFALTKMDQSPR